MEIINNSPKVYIINNFLTDEECEHFINISKDNIKPALVSGDKEGYVSNGRTGQNCWLKHNFDSITKSVANKISEEVGIPIENAEAFQIIYYDKNQEYKQHYDGWLFDGSEKSKRNMKYGGQRMKTALVYLNDVESGGGTKFTKLNMEVNAEKGKLLVFENVHSGTNKRHELSEHAGMPVIEGEKWAFNLWFREESRDKLYDYNKEETPLKPPQRQSPLNQQEEVSHSEFSVLDDLNFSIENSGNHMIEELKTLDVNKNYKTSMNDEWRGWVYNQKLRGLCLNKIEEKLKKQNYSPHLIYDLLYKENTDIKNQEIKEKNKLKKIVNMDEQFPEYFLEIGDYFPFIKIGSKELHNITNDKDILIVIIDKIEQLVLDKILTLQNNNNLFLLYGELEENLNIPNYFINKNKFPNILEKDKNLLYILDANRRIKDLKEFNNIQEIIDFKMEKNILSINVPYLMIENVLDDKLLKRVLDYYNNSSNQELHNSCNKNRLHVHPDQKLEKMIDNKLSRSLFPEIKKIFYFDVEYRELYKICSYNSETNGRFAAHRDTPYPHQHRKFALSLILNDDYEGGELFLPEYNVKLKPKANTAIVFPGICTHQVNPIISGSRKTIITFFCTEKPDDPQANERNRVKSNFFIERKVENSLVYPF